MNWVELSRSAEFIGSKYAQAPDLSTFLIREFFLGEGSSLRIYGELSRAPDEHTNDPCAVAQVGFAFWDVQSFQVIGCPSGIACSMTIHKRADGMLSVRGDGEKCAFEFIATSFEVESFGVYTSASAVAHKRSLKSFHTTWNTCLLILQEAGYEVELRGSPAPDGSAANCRWVATNEQTELEASNPIELLGLAKVEQSCNQEGKEPYWWRKEGLDLVTDLMTGWIRQWRGPDNDDDSEPIARLSE